MLTGQTAAGVFKTSADFLNGNLFYADKKTNLRLHEVLPKNYVDITHRDSSYRFLKSDLYGYSDKAGNAYRFYKNDIYPILNPGEKILIYKITSGTGLKNSPVTETWFFSKDAASAVLPLKIANVLSAFSDDKAFTSLLEMYYKNAADLIAYDTEHHQYKLNRILEISTQFKLQ